MATLLSLVNDARQECGITSGDLTSLSSITGENLRFKNWTIKAWEEIQGMHDDWYFLRGDYSFTTTANDGSYTGAQAGIATRFLDWDISWAKVYLTASGTSDETEIYYLNYEDFRIAYLTGSQTSGRPLYFSVGLDQELLLGPAPDSTAYTIAGQYRKTPQTLSADADVVDIPEQSGVIVYRTMKKYARYESAGEIYADAMNEEQRMMRILEKKYLPNMRLAEPLA